MAENLYSLVSQATKNNNRSDKVQFGYSVDAYAGVLAAIQTAANNTQSSLSDSGVTTSVVGDDYSKINSLRWDNNNFAEDTEACLWKMSLDVIGSLPIEYSQNGRFDIIRVKGMSDEFMSNCKSQLPFLLDQNALNATHLQDQRGNFTVGAFIDGGTPLLNYFNKFFVTTQTVGGQGAFTDEIVKQLLYGGFLVAQIIPIGSEMSVEVGIVGEKPLSGGMPILCVSAPLFATANFNQLKVNLTVNGGEQIVPNGTNYTCITQGESYNYKTKSIAKLNLENFNKWLNNKIQGEEPHTVLEIDHLETKSYNVRIYIPADKKAEAQKILPSGVSDRIYGTYSGARYGEGNIPASVGGDVKRMMECITQACVKRNCKLWTIEDCRKNTGFNGGVNRAPVGRGINVGMGGFFYIPKGWPMCKISQGYNGRSIADQIRKGHPEQIADKSTLKPWVVPDDPDRMDSALNSLSQQVLRGNMPKEWYQARLEKANKGNIKIYCNKNRADAWQSFFNQVWDTYGEAAMIYNTGRPQEEHISAGEIMLRCAPCLCAMNGANTLHRSRMKNGQYRKNGHDAGQAIDFDPIHNGVMSSATANCTRTEIGKGMEVAYRPALHYIYAVNGAWGGAYGFCQGQYDAMHFQV